MLPYITFSVQHLELVIRMDKRGLVRRGIFSSDRVREPTLSFDAEYNQQMDELIELMQDICQNIQADRPRFAGTQLKPS
jgi:hypothetical protein